MALGFENTKENTNSEYLERTTASLLQCEQTNKIKEKEKTKKQVRKQKPCKKCLKNLIKFNKRSKNPIFDRFLSLCYGRPMWFKK